MAKEETIRFKQSKWAELEHESALEYAKAEGFAKGFAKGITKATAKKLKLNGMPIEMIMQYTNLTEQQIAEL